MNDRQQMKEHYRQIVKEKYGIENFDIEPVKTERECPECGGMKEIRVKEPCHPLSIVVKSYVTKCPICQGSGKIQEKAGGECERD